MFRIYKYFYTTQRDIFKNIVLELRTFVLKIRVGNVFMAKKGLKFLSKIQNSDFCKKFDFFLVFPS